MRLAFYEAAGTLPLPSQLLFDSMTSTKKGECKVVLIPADPHEDITEETVSYTEDTEVSCIQDLAKAHFRRKKPTKTAQQLAAQKEAFLQQVPEEQRKGISDALVDQALGMNMVEHVALLSNATDNNFTGVTMYCDDEAVAVGLPLNARASEISSCAGKPSEVRGDVFLARVFDNEESFERLDFTLAEVSSSAPWVKEAHAQNRRKQNAESSAATLQRIERQSKASARVKELSPAEARKEEGNELFKKGDFASAVDAYTQAIALDSKLVSAYNNRAMARLKVGDWDGAEADANHVLESEAVNVKALLRRASAREQLGKTEAALQDFEEVLQLEPDNKMAAARAQELQSV